MHRVAGAVHRTAGLTTPLSAVTETIRDPVLAVAGGVIAARAPKAGVVEVAEEVGVEVDPVVAGSAGNAVHV